MSQCPQEIPPFHSILYASPEQRGMGERPAPPDYFADLNLDQLAASLAAGRETYQLAPFFHTSLRSAAAITYRQEIMRDLEGGGAQAPIKRFAEQLRAMRARLAQRDKLYYQAQKKAWLLEAVRGYCDAIAGLAQGLAGAELGSGGLLAFRHFLADYSGSEPFRALLAELQQVEAGLAAVHYNLLIRGSCVTVSRYGSETDYSAEVEETFRKFQQGAVADYLMAFQDRLQMSQLEADILDRVARLFPEAFQALDAFCVMGEAFVDPAIAGFDREIQFYLGYLDLMAPLKDAGLPFCYPEIATEDKEIRSSGGFDLVLARQLVQKGAPVVCNDFHLRGKERILVVTGPNQGGKTTFARAFGQLHHVASLGLPVPGRAARLLLFDQLHTHFEQEENLENLRGRLHDDLVRVHRILAGATPATLVILNEIFASTTVKDAEYLSRKIMGEILDKDLLAVWVTFIDELAALNEQTVSMVSTVVPDHPEVRTFTLVRKPADGMAYAMSIVEKHRLTLACIKERIQP